MLQYSVTSETRLFVTNSGRTSDGKVPKKITSNEKIVYAYDVWDTLRIMNADGTEKHGLIYPKKTRIGFMAPVWSKATGQIAVRVISDSSHIEITDENGKSWKYLLYMGEFPQWSPDGSRIAYWTENTGKIFVTAMK